MQNDRLGSEDIFRESERLHKKHEAAQRDRTRAQPILEKLQIRCEDARMRLQGANASPGTQESRIVALSKECERCEAERNAEIKAVEGAYMAAENEARTHDGKYISAARGFLETTRKKHDFDQALNDFLLSGRQELEQLGKELRPLREIAARFEEIREKLEAWQFTGPNSEEWTVSGYHKRRMEIPRLSDFLR